MIAIWATKDELTLAFVGVQVAASHTELGFDACLAINTFTHVNVG